MKKLSKFVGGLLGGKESNLWLPNDRPYPRLTEADAPAREGIYAVWHLGVRPQWLRVGATTDLGAAFRTLEQTPWIVTHQGNAGIYVAWGFPPATQYAGMVRHLTETLTPAFQGEVLMQDLALDAVAPAIVCALPPGTRT